MKATQFEKQFLDMYNALLKIAKSYSTPQQLHKEAGRYGLSYDDTIEMAYENIQGEAKHAIKGIRIKKFIQLMKEKYSPETNEPQNA